MIFVNIKKIIMATTREEKVKEAAKSMVKGKMELIEKVLLKSEEAALEIMFDLTAENVELTKRVEELEEQLTKLRAVVGRKADVKGEA
jgi:CRISPR/Cas system-associated endonuclease Cas1